jgi:AcrR family transcriptional regulator
MIDTDIEQKQRIIRATVTCISEFGIDGATFRRVAERAGVSVGQVQYYFPSKKELVVATHLASVEAVRRLADEASGQDRSPARLESMFAVNLTTPESGLPPFAFWLWYWAEATIDPDLRDTHQQRFRVTRDLLAECIRVGIDRGELRKDIDPELGAELCFAVLSGLEVEVAIDAPIVSADRAMEAARLMLRLMRNPT